MYNEEILVDKKIIGVRIKGPTIWLQVDGGGWIEITVRGDCCSYGSIDSVYLIPGIVLNGKTVEVHSFAFRTTQECDKITSVGFLGDGGYLSIVHRNSSNGWYDNYLEISARGEPPEDAVNDTHYIDNPYNIKDPFKNGSVN